VTGGEDRTSYLRDLVRKGLWWPFGLVTPPVGGYCFGERFNPNHFHIRGKRPFLAHGPILQSNNTIGAKAGSGGTAHVSVRRVYAYSTDDRRVLRGVARRKDSGGGHVMGSYAETRGQDEGGQGVGNVITMKTVLLFIWSDK